VPTSNRLATRPRSRTRPAVGSVILQYLQQRALTGAVSSDNAEDIPAPNVEAHVPQRPKFLDLVALHYSSPIVQVLNNQNTPGPRPIGRSGIGAICGSMPSWRRPRGQRRRLPAQMARSVVEEATAPARDPIPQIHMPNTPMAHRTLEPRPPHARQRLVPDDWNRVPPTQRSCVRMASWQTPASCHPGHAGPAGGSRCAITVKN
jgi:hypothetical protein